MQAAVLTTASFLSGLLHLVPGMLACIFRASVEVYAHQQVIIAPALLAQERGVLQQ